jgi:hypothetical protein
MLLLGADKVVPMPKIRFVISMILALGTLFVCSLYAFSFYGLVPAGLDKGSSIIAIILSTMAFVLCIRIKSYAVGGLLTVGGILLQIPPVQTIVTEGTITIPGPILGVIFFCPVLIFGLVKLARSKPKAPFTKVPSVRVSD